MKEANQIFVPTAGFDSTVKEFYAYSPAVRGAYADHFDTVMLLASHTFEEAAGARQNEVVSRVQGEMVDLPRYNAFAAALALGYHDYLHPEFGDPSFSLEERGYWLRGLVVEVVGERNVKRLSSSHFENLAYVHDLSKVISRELLLQIAGVCPTITNQQHVETHSLNWQAPSHLR